MAGDLQPLADRLRNARNLLPEERALAAGIVDGTRKVKKPAHRPASDKTRKQQTLLALDVWKEMHLALSKKRRSRMSQGVGEEGADGAESR